MTHPYGTADFARGLPHLGEPFAVPEWDSHVLVRPTPSGGRADAIGPYPVTPLYAEADLEGGLARQKAAGLVATVLVLEDCWRPSEAVLSRAFSLLRPFKTHQVYDRRLGPIAYAGQHRTKLKRALGRVDRREIRLTDHLAAWEALYGHLAERHGLNGLHLFPKAHHEALAALPGVRTFGAFVGGTLVSAHIFVAQEGHAVSHLTASNAEGYAAGAAYAVNDLAIQAMSDCRTINFGGGAGFGDDAADGLVQFKRGFANRTAPAWIAGAVHDAAAYESLSRGAAGGFFPAYRAPRATG